MCHLISIHTATGIVTFIRSGKKCSEHTFANLTHFILPFKDDFHKGILTHYCVALDTKCTQSTQFGHVILSNGTVTISNRFPVISYKEVRRGSEVRLSEIAAIQPSFADRRGKRRVEVAYEEEQNKET
jgi:hypothetical protein